MTADMVQHGDAHHQMNSAPAVGARVAMDGIGIDLIPAQPMEVNFLADVDVLTIGLGAKSWTRAYDTDKLSPLDFLPGQMVQHPKGSSCYARTEDASQEMLALFVDPSLRAACLEDMPGRKRPGMDQVYAELTSPNVLPMAQMIRRMHLSGQLDNRMSLQSVATLALTESLWAATSDLGERPPCTVLSKAGVMRAVEYMNATLAENPGLTDVAAEVGLTPYHFSRSFKAATGVSPHQYIIELRLTRAREMLQQSNVPLADVAYAVGFSSQAHMTDTFRKKVGVTPAKLRSVSHS